jgi:hypothetical protein
MRYNLNLEYKTQLRENRLKKIRRKTDDLS